MSNSILFTSASAQRLRLLDRLRGAGGRGVTTIEARDELDIMMPGARVHELRHDYGFNIRTLWTHAPSAQGINHRTARYVLFPGKYEEVTA